MNEAVLIYGKNRCPFTWAAREAYAASGRTVVYRDVLADPGNLASMLACSGGNRKIPVIVDGDRVTIGFERRA